MSVGQPPAGVIALGDRDGDIMPPLGCCQNGRWSKRFRWSYWRRRVCDVRHGPGKLNVILGLDFKNNRFNLFVVAISVGFGLIPLAAPGFFRNLPHNLQPLLESGILLCALVAVGLNAFFNGVGRTADAEAEAAAAASSAQHV
jgi:hypothetical protein